eukprot:1066416-Rhodomonas_salina.1
MAVQACTTTRHVSTGHRASKSRLVPDLCDCQRLVARRALYERVPGSSTGLCRYHSLLSRYAHVSTAEPRTLEKDASRPVPKRTRARNVVG